MAWTELFADNFDARPNGAPSAPWWNSSPTSGVVWNGRLQNDGYADGVRSVVDMVTPDDQRVSAKSSLWYAYQFRPYWVLLVRGLVGGGLTNFGGRGYTFGPSYNGSGFVLLRHSGASSTILGQGSDPVDATAARYRIAAEGSLLTLDADGVVLGSVTDAMWPSGVAGVGVTSNKAWAIDDFLIESAAVAPSGSPFGNMNTLGRTLVR